MVQSGSKDQKYQPQVLHVGPLPPPMGGLASAVTAILECPALQRVQQDVFNTSAGQPIEIVGRKSITFSRIFRRLGLAWKLMRDCLRRRPFILHFHIGSESLGNILGDLIIMWAGAIGAKRVILHFHGDPSVTDLPGKTGFSQYIFNLFITPVNRVIVLNRRFQTQFLEAGVQKEVEIIPNLCDQRLEFFSRSNYLGVAQEFRVLFLGRLTQEKGFFDLLKVANLLKTMDGNIHFDVCGLSSKETDLQTIQQTMSDLQLDQNVHLHGLVTGEEKIDKFRTANLLFIPSHAESFGITCIEGMAAGLPVVATRVNGLQQILSDRFDGYLLDVGDIDGMANAIYTLRSDPGLRDRIAMNGKKTYQCKYSNVVIGGKLASIYQSLLYQDNPD